MEATEHLENIQEVYQLDLENKLCVDCRKSEPEFASVNNGVVICAECAEIHKGLGVHISYVRSLKTEWDEYLMSYIRVGGNGRFMRMLNDYGISESLDITEKYRLKACESYRNYIKSEVLNEDPPEVLSANLGKEISPCTENHYPEFENYVLMPKDNTPDITPQAEEKPKKKSIMNSVGGFFKKVGKTVQTKLKAMNIRDKIKTTFQIIQTTSGYVVIKSEQNLKKLRDKTSHGADVVKEKAKEYFHNIKKKFTKKEDLEKDNQNNPEMKIDIEVPPKDNPNLLPDNDNEYPTLEELDKKGN